MAYERPDVVDKINAIRDLVHVVADSLDKTKEIDSCEAQRMAYVLTHFVCGGLDECDEMLQVEDDPVEDREEEDQGSEASSS